MKSIKTGIRYIKVGRPDLVRYFSPESIKYYNPERNGWVRDENDHHPAPEDVINYMENKLETGKETEMKDYSMMATRRLEEIIGDLTESELLNIIKIDKRVTARRIAEKEIQKRENDHTK